MAPSNSKLIAELMNNNTTINTEAIPNGSGVSIGSVIPFGGSSAPTGFLACDGAYLDRTVYADLFGAIGTTWGTTTSDNFRLPDLRGRFIRGSNNATGTYQGEATRELNFRSQNQTNGIEFRFGETTPVWWGGGNQGIRTVIGHPYQGNNIANNLSAARAYGDMSPRADNAEIVVMRTNGWGGSSEIRPTNASTLYIIKY